MSVLLHLTGVDEIEWAARLQPLLGDYPVVTRASGFDPVEVDYILVWKPDAHAFDGLANLKAVLSYGAGVDALLTHPALPDLPIVRFVDEDLTARMRDYVVSEILVHHRFDTLFRTQQRHKTWRQIVPPRAEDVSVGVMGLGVLGEAVLTALGGLGFRRLGWSRSQKTLSGVTTFSGTAGLDAFLGATDILVCLLPLTIDTRGILSRKLFVKLRRDGLPGGPVVINAARGGHQVEADLVAALTDGTLGAASLDVFEIEPLPEQSPLWDLPNCRITPHIAAIGSAESGAVYFARAIGEHRAGRDLPNVVDRTRGY